MIDAITSRSLPGFVTLYSDMHYDQRIFCEPRSTMRNRFEKKYGGAGRLYRARGESFQSSRFRIER